MSTKTKKREAKKRTKTLEDDLLAENKSKKSSMPLPKVRKLTSTKVSFFLILLVMFKFEYFNLFGFQTPNSWFRSKEQRILPRDHKNHVGGKLLMKLTSWKDAFPKTQNGLRKRLIL